MPPAASRHPAKYRVESSVEVWNRCTRSRRAWLRGELGCWTCFELPCGVASDVDVDVMQEVRLKLESFDIARGAAIDGYLIDTPSKYR